MKGKLRTFEDTLLILLKMSKEGPMTVETFFTILSGRGKILLMIFLCLPLGQVPGISLPFGLLIGFLGIRVAFFNNRIWLPKCILRRHVPKFIMKNTVKQLLQGIKIMKKWTRPRYTWSIELPYARVINGLLIALVGFSLTISPFLPIVSILAFVAVLLIGIGMLNDDGLYTILGYFFSLLYCVCAILWLKYIPVEQTLEFFHQHTGY